MQDKVYQKNILKQVLIVNNEQNILSMISTMLKKNMFEVHTAVSGEIALNKISEIMPQIVIIDYIISDMNGYEMLENIKQKKEYKKVRTIFVSPITDCKTRVKAIKAGVDDFIIKPFSPDELLFKVNLLSRIIDLENNYLTNEKLISAIKNVKKMGHAINNPLTTILGNAEMLLEEDMKNGQKKMIEIVRNESLRVAELVNQMMDDLRSLSL